MAVTETNPKQANLPSNRRGLRNAGKISPAEKLIWDVTGQGPTLGVMKLVRLNPVLRTVSICAASLGCLAAPALSQSSEDLPRLLILPGEPEALLPGDASGARHGVVVRRGSGFPEPVVEEEPEPEEVVRPDPPTQRATIRRRSRSGY